jgi:signal transduction histidine kinase
MAAIGQLAAGVAHEINNPVGFINSNLNTMSGYQQDLGRLLERYALLERAAADGEQAQAALLAEIASLKKDIDLEFVLEDSVNTIKESQEGVARIKDIVAALKDFSRLDQAELTSADIIEGLESTLKIVWNELKYKCTVVKDFGPLPHLVCHPRQLNQVFMNLLVNAAQAIEEKGEIKIATRAFEGERPHIEVQIEDTGRGIPPENLPRIFEPFFTTKPVGKGTGLGLHIAYDIVAKHGGSLSVASEVGRGTTFTISLPLDGLERTEAKGEHRDEQPLRLAS